MKGYIKRLAQDIEKIKDKKGRLDEFFAYRAFKECDGKQVELLHKQQEIMEQLIAVMEERFKYELELHPQFEEEAEKRVDDADDCDDSEEATEE